MLSPDKHTDIPSKHFVCLQNIFKTSSRHVFKKSSRHVFKTSSRHIFKTNKCLLGTSYSDIFSHIVAYLEPCETLSYSEPCAIFRIQAYLEPKIYSGLCQGIFLILLNKNIKFNKNETESKMENPRHSFRETILVLQLI